MTYQNLTTKVEILGQDVLLDAQGNNITDAEDGNINTTGFVDSTDMVRLSSPITWERGNFGTTVLDRVADVGKLDLVLDNSENNPHGLGWFSPGRAGSAPYFDLDTVIRVTQIEDDTTEHAQWYGRISRIEPSAGVYGERTTLVTAEDWMATATRAPIKGITVQESKRDDELITTLLTLSPIQPLATNLATGADTYTLALHDENSKTSSLMRLFNKIALSGLGKIFLSGYETLSYLDRTSLLLSSTPVATISDTMRDVKLTYAKEFRVYETEVIVYPGQIDVGDVTLWEAQNEMTILAGETKEFEVQLRDPNGRAQFVAGKSLATPVAGTTYKFSSVSGSESGDLNANLTLTYTLKSDIVAVSAENTGGSTGYLAPHLIKGKGVYLYEPVTKAKFTGQPDGETLRIDMVYQDDLNVGDDISNLVTAWFTTDLPRVESVTFLANTSQTLVDASFADIGDLVTIQESLTGLDENYVINGIRKTSSLNGRFTEVTWALVPANQIGSVCILDLVGSAELDSTAILGA